jgi:hypothetical protein
VTLRFRYYADLLVTKLAPSLLSSRFNDVHAHGLYARSCSDIDIDAKRLNSDGPLERFLLLLATTAGDGYIYSFRF